MNLYDKLFTPRVFTLPNGKQICKRRSRAPFAVLILLAMTALSVRVDVYKRQGSLIPAYVFDHQKVSPSAEPITVPSTKPKIVEPDV